MRVLVTGATGYIGFHVAAALSREGHEVIGMSRASEGLRLRELVAQEVEPFRADLSRPESYRSALDGIDAVVHTALDQNGPLDTDIGLLDEVVAAKDRGACDPLFVYTSGFSVYGTHEESVVDESTPIDEHGFRGRVERRLAEVGLVHTVMRLAFVYGLDSRHSPLGDWFAAAENGECTHSGRTDKRWGWVHVADAAHAYALLLRDPERHDGQAYCLIGDGEAPAALELHERAARAAGFAGPTRFDSIEAEAADLRVFDRHEAGPNDRAKRQLGWVPRHPGPARDLPKLYRAWAAARAT